MSISKEDFVLKINEITKVFWDKTKRPLLLSEVRRELLAAKVDENYAELFAGESLKSFLLGQTQEDNVEFNIVFHPSQKAKIGLIPNNETFAFDENDAQTRHSVRKNNKDALIDFLRQVADLEQNEINEIKIPTSVLVKLLVK